MGRKKANSLKNKRIEKSVILLQRTPYITIILIASVIVNGTYATINLSAPLLKNTGLVSSKFGTNVEGVMVIHIQIAMKYIKNIVGIISENKFLILNSVDRNIYHPNAGLVLMVSMPAFQAGGGGSSPLSRSK